MTEEELIRILVEYIWANKDKILATTDYEKSILLANELRDKALTIIYQRWKEDVRDGKK
jgi:hypothetical protein